MVTKEKISVIKKMRKEVPQVSVTLVIPEKTFVDIDKIVGKIPNMTKNQFMSNLLLMGLDDVKLLDSLGMITGIQFVRSVMREAANMFLSEEKGI